MSHSNASVVPSANVITEEEGESSYSDRIPGEGHDHIADFPRRALNASGGAIPQPGGIWMNSKQAEETNQKQANMHEIALNRFCEYLQSSSDLQVQDFLQHSSRRQFMIFAEAWTLVLQTRKHIPFKNESIQQILTDYHETFGRIMKRVALFGRPLILLKGDEIAALSTPIVEKSPDVPFERT